MSIRIYVLRVTTINKIGLIIFLNSIINYDEAATKLKVNVTTEKEFNYELRVISNEVTYLR